jgi:transcriptional regulator with XRE-family HTH domain
MDMLSQRIRSARKSKGMSQAELAKRVGTDQGHISRLESGETGASLDIITRLAKQLDLTVSQLVGDDVPDYESGHPASRILSDPDAPEGLQAFARDVELVKALNVTTAEWEALASVKLPGEVAKDGYVQLLITIRAVC